jgi:hypothetical protein
MVQATSDIEQEVGRRIVGPMQVLDEHDGRLTPERGKNGREQLIAG